MCNAWSSRFQIQVLTALFILCIHIPDSLSESAASAVSADLCHTPLNGRESESGISILPNLK
jgi:hypothetical protein